MEKYSSYEKGDSFEERVFKIINIILENDDFYVSGKKSKVFRKKGYYGRERESTIIFDITIETFIGNSDEYSLLTVIECKNYKNPVPVGDIEEFKSNINQVSAHNTKGIIVSNNTFQEGAYKSARNTGLGLVRIMDNDEYEWIVRRKEKTTSYSQEETKEKFINQENSAENFIAEINNKLFSNFADLLIDLKAIDYYIHKEKFIRIPYVSDEKIDTIVSKLQSKNIYDGVVLNIEKLCSFLESVYTITFDIKANLENNVLGKIQFDPLRIEVNKSLENDIGRKRFTIAHEVGHLLLHYKILVDKINERKDIDLSFSFLYNISDKNNKRLELQANNFASHLLIPENTLITVVEKYFKDERIHKGFLYWDNQPVNQRLIFTILNQISLTYQVSFEVSRIRMISLGILKDERFKSVRDVLKELYS